MPAQLDSLYIRTRPAKAITRLISYALFEGRPLTTRGRWINPLIFTLFEMEKRLPQIRKVKKPIFITGMGRSGTTVLGTALSMHKDVGFLNEPKALWHSIFPSEDIIGNYTEKPARFRLFAEDAGVQVRSDAHHIMGAYLALTGSTRVVDKYPEMVFRIPFVRAIFPDAKFIFLVRNGWDTCASVNVWSQMHARNFRGQKHDWWGRNKRKWTLMINELVMKDPELGPIGSCAGSLDNNLDMAAVEWILTMREGLRQIRLNGANVHIVKYEDLALSPEKVMGDLLVFCELEPDAVFMNYSREVLKPARQKGTFKLHPKIRPLFEQTLNEIGY